MSVIFQQNSKQLTQSLENRSFSLLIQPRRLKRSIEARAVYTSRNQQQNAQDILVKNYQEMNLIYKKDVDLIDSPAIRHLEQSILDNGQAIHHIRRFNTLLGNLTFCNWEQKLRPVFGEFVYNLESFNPAFTAVLLKVQQSIGQSEYIRRDMALKNLIQPLAGEYGLHINQQQGKTHRELFADFYKSLFQQDVQLLLNDYQMPNLSVSLHKKMISDILSGGNQQDATQQAVYALGYNLAIEYLADYEKTWMLDSFKKLNKTIKKDIDWVFLEVHAEGEKEHAQIGHQAITHFVKPNQTQILIKGMQDHDRDFATFYGSLADIIEQE